MKLIQKRFFLGKREFELSDNEIHVQIINFFSKKELVIPLVILNPIPIRNKNELDFHSRVKCGPLFSFYINKPSLKEFELFTEALSQKAEQAYNSFTGIK
tara:strand:+ start:3928 stop:4227 length:300 start_codon:yes stop_codon:yes gene_type:complete